MTLAPQLLGALSKVINVKGSFLAQGKKVECHSLTTNRQIGTMSWSCNAHDVFK